MQAQENAANSPRAAVGATPPSASSSGTMDPVRVVEAALFSAGKPLALDEIAENARLPRAVAKDALTALATEYEARETALEVARAGHKWAMQVKARYAPAAERLAPMEIPARTLKTLALIAYHQPVLQSQLIELVGDKAYDHVRELVERGLVKKRVHERSFMLLTSDLFPEYFGIPASDREEMKVFLANKLGIPLPRTDARGNVKLRTFAGGGSTEAEATSAGAPEPAAPAADAATAATHPPAPPSEHGGAG